MAIPLKPAVLSVVVFLVGLPAVAQPADDAIATPGSAEDPRQPQGPLIARARRVHYA